MIISLQVISGHQIEPPITDKPVSISPEGLSHWESTVSPELTVNIKYNIIMTMIIIITIIIVIVIVIVII